MPCIIFLYYLTTSSAKTAGPDNHGPPERQDENPIS